MENMATLSFYQRVGKDNGLEFVEFVDLIENFPMHFTAVSTPPRPLRSRDFAGVVPKATGKVYTSGRSRSRSVAKSVTKVSLTFRYEVLYVALDLSA